MTLFRRNQKQEIREHDFWRYSVKFYQQKAVKTACLYLQNAYHLNVNLILCCLWYAASGRGVLSKKELRQLINSLEPWQHKLTQPLRASRQKFPKKSSATLQKIRSELLNLELYSEKIQQSLIFDFLITHYKIHHSQQQRTKDGTSNIQNYLSVAKVSLNEIAYAHTRQLLAMAFPGFAEKDFPQMSLPLNF